MHCFLAGIVKTPELSGKFAQAIPQSLVREVAVPAAEAVDLLGLGHHTLR